MATTTVKREPYVPGDRWHSRVEWVGDSSYANGGEAISRKELGAGPEAVFDYANVLYVKPLSEQGTYRPTTAYFDGSKIHLYDAATGKELEAGKDTSKITVGLEVVWKAR